jgi:hypothetical protein
MKMMSKDHGKYIYDYQTTEWKEFYGFKAEQKFNFLLIRFQCSDTMKFYHNRSKNGVLDSSFTLPTGQYTQLYTNTSIYVTINDYLTVNITQGSGKDFSFTMSN